MRSHFLLALILSLIGWPACLSKVSAQPFSFDRLHLQNGSLNRSVLAIAQDEKGFIWFGTRNGVAWYDGVQLRNAVVKKSTGTIPVINYTTVLSAFKGNNLWIGGADQLMRHNAEKNYFEDVTINGAPAYGVTAIFYDRTSRLWVGSNAGLHLLKNEAKQEFESFTPADGLAGRQVTAIFEDHAGNLWIGTDNGLTKLTQVQAGFSFQTFRSDPALQNKTIHANYITTIAEDGFHRLWIGTKHEGVSLFDPVATTFTPIKHDVQKKGGLVNNNVRKIISTRRSKIWIGTQEGISIVDPQSFQFTTCQNEAGNEKSLSQNSVYSLYEDKNGTIWVGTYFGGVNKVYGYHTKFHTLQKQSTTNSLSNNVVSSIVEDEQSNLWIGTEGGGLNYLNRASNTFTVYTNEPGNPYSLGSNLVKFVYQDGDKNTWVGTHGGGLNVFDRATKRFHRYLLDEKDPAALNDGIFNLAEDTQGRFWVASNSSLKLFQRKGTTLEPLAISSQFRSFPNITVQTFFRDKSGTFWIGAAQGLYVVSGASLQPVYTSGFVNCINEDRDGNIWAGLNNNGLLRYNPESKKLTTYAEREGLHEKNILGLLFDDQGSLWMSTDKGLLKFDPQQTVLRTYTTSDGLVSDEFNFNSYLKDHNGELFFGGYNGITHFFPNDIDANNAPAPLLFTGLKLYSEDVRVGDQTEILARAMSTVESLRFRHDQEVFTIEFALLNYIKSEKNRYAYKLEGVDRAWNETATPAATYIKLPPGTYTLLVKGANNDGVWSQPISMQIVILPPFWRTWVAYGIYLLLASLVVFFITRYFFLRALLKKEDALHQVKLNFFTNVSHEIRTHLTLIMAPVDQLLGVKKPGEFDYQTLSRVKKNANRLLRLVNELMDFRKTENANMKLQISRTNLIPFLLDIFYSFQEVSQEKEISLSFIHDTEEVFLYFDPAQMEKVFFNLLTNALKFTPRGGRILVQIEQTGSDVCVSVSDNGRGIAPEFLDKLFTNFFQVPDEKQNTGYGIGLALSKNIVELHSGKIEVNSTVATTETEGKTTFTVRLPKGNKHFDRTGVDVTAPDASNESTPGPTINGTVPVPAKISPQAEQKPLTILVVEDNVEIRTILQQTFTSDFNVLESINGMEGWQIATEQLPDLVISDVMMPEMDGFSLCAKLKTDERTSHIPVILLTAKSAQTDQISGLETGADVYLTKPFNMRILAQNARNLLASREKMRQQIRRELIEHRLESTTVSAVVESQPLSTIDKEFLQKVIELVNDNLDNPDFGVEMLCRKVAMSAPILYKKLKAITNLSVNDFVKSIRLKRAAELILKKELTVYQVAFAVGYEDRKYFSREFKKLYGVNPSEYAESTAKQQQ